MRGLISSRVLFRIDARIFISWSSWTKRVRDTGRERINSKEEKPREGDEGWLASRDRKRDVENELQLRRLGGLREDERTRRRWPPGIFYVSLSISRLSTSTSVSRPVFSASFSSLPNAASSVSFVDYVGSFPFPQSRRPTYSLVRFFLFSYIRIIYLCIYRNAHVPYIYSTFLRKRHLYPFIVFSLFLLAEISSLSFSLSTILPRSTYSDGCNVTL